MTDTTITMNPSTTSAHPKSVNTIDPDSRMGFNSLYLDFLAQKPKALEFYPNQNVTSSLKQIDSRKFDRAAIADILLKQNKKFGADQSAMAMIDKLRESNSVVVFAGQQAGLFGGPLLGVYKALWAIKQAKRLEGELSRPVIPIFWIAADDHDFDEINHTYVYDMLGEPLNIRYYSEAHPGAPAYNRKLDDTKIFEEVVNRLKEALGDTDFTSELYNKLLGAYSSGSDFVTAFGKFMATLLSSRDLVLFSPGDDEFKKRSADFYKTLIDRRDSLKSTLQKANDKLTSASYHLQTLKDDSACHMFMLNPERTAIHTDGMSYSVGDSKFTRDELINNIKKSPERFSPDVISRPLLAAYHFPTLVQGGGPSEVAYFAQLATLYETLELSAPVFSGRISATIVEKRFEKLFEKHSLSVESFFDDVEQVINTALGKYFPQDLEKQFADIKADFKKQFDSLSQSVVEFDKSLDGNSGQMWGKIESALDTFEKKAFASHKRKLSDERAAIYRAANAFFPNRALQERSISVVYYLSRYGMGLIDFLDQSLENTTTGHQLISVSEMTK